MNTDQLAFVKKYADDMLVATSVGTSVNHVIAQKRSITETTHGRDDALQECVALQFDRECQFPTSTWRLVATQSAA